MKEFLSRTRPEDDKDHAPHSYFGALGGLGFFVLSMVFIVGGFDLGLGSARRLGTGAFPVITGFILAVLSMAVIAAELQDTTDAEIPDWISFVAIGGALAVFALTVGRIGLVPGVFLTVITANLPDRSLGIPGKAVLAAFVALACWGLFIGVIGLPFDAFMGI